MDRCKNYAETALKYAKDVVSGSIPACLYVKQACQRHLDDLERQDWPYTFNPTLTDQFGRKYRPGDRVCQFVELFCHVKGEWKGKPYVLEPWQTFRNMVAFGWVRKDTGARRFNEIYQEVPRKNGKSMDSATLGLYMFAADQEGGAEVYVGANGEYQANKVFAPAWLMAKQNEDFMRHFSVVAYGKTPETGKLGNTTDYSKMERLIGNPGDGDMPSCYLCDEFHEHATPYQYDTMSTGMGSRRQPMIIITTTAGINKNGPCYEKRAQAINVLKGTYTNEQLFALIYTVDEGDDWRDIAVWKKANPNYGVSFFEDYVVRKLQEAEQTLSKQAIILCKNLNIWQDSYSSWLDMDQWRKCADESIREDDFIGECPCYIGADLGAVKDLVAIVRVYLKGEKYYVFSSFHLPSEAANDPGKTNYLQWVQAGYINVHPGRTIDFDIVEDEIYDFLMMNRMAKEFALDMGFSAWPLMSSLQKRLEKKRGKKATDEMLIEYGKTVKNFSEPMKQLEKAIIDGNIVHDCNPVLSWCMGNIVVHVDKKENILATKEHADLKIDGGDALITAFARAIMHDKENTKGNDGSLL